MNFLKATIATAAITVCCLGNEMPANANKDVSSANEVCSNLVELNQTLGMSVAPLSHRSTDVHCVCGEQLQRFLLRRPVSHKQT